MKTVIVLTLKAFEQTSERASGYLEVVETGEEFVFRSISELLELLEKAAGRQTVEPSVECL